MSPILFKIGSIPIWAYGASLTVAFIFGAWFGAKRARRVGMDGDHVWNVATWGFVAAILGARLVHVVWENPALMKHPGQWLSIWQGGLVFYGGFIAAVLSSIIYCRVKKLSFLQMGDILAPVIALGHGFVRLGCFFNGCCFGKPVAWGVTFPVLGDKTPRHPTQLYEAAAGVILFFALQEWEKRKQPPRGEVLFLYLGLYGLTRFLIEFVRADDRGSSILGLSISQTIGLSALLIGVIGLLLGRRRLPA